MSPLFSLTMTTLDSRYVTYIWHTYYNELKVDIPPFLQSQRISSENPLYTNVILGNKIKEMNNNGGFRFLYFHTILFQHRCGLFCSDLGGVKIVSQPEVNGTERESMKQLVCVSILKFPWKNLSFLRNNFLCYYYRFIDFYNPFSSCVWKYNYNLFFNFLYKFFHTQFNIFFFSIYKHTWTVFMALFLEWGVLFSLFYVNWNGNLW